MQKGGTAPITAVLDYGDRVTEPELSLLNGPGNDMVAVTNLCAAGCHLILFTTGRGTPLGAPVPTIKIATNTTLAKKKPGWIDLDAQTATTDDLFNLILRPANGQEAQNERHGYRFQRRCHPEKSAKKTEPLYMVPSFVLLDGLTLPPR